MHVLLKVFFFSSNCTANIGTVVFNQFVGILLPTSSILDRPMAQAANNPLSNEPTILQAMSQQSL